jgi:hypothetical protein
MLERKSLASVNGQMSITSLAPPSESAHINESSNVLARER